MAFKIASPEKLAEKPFWRTVTLYVPSENASGQTKVDFEAQFRPLPKDEEKAALDALTGDSDYEERWFKDHVVGFRGVVDDETGEALAFDEALRRVYQFTPARQATMRAYHAAMTGQKGNG